MVARCFCTLVMLLLAFYAFWGNALGAGYILNPFGLLCLLLAGMVWFKWEIVRSAFRSVNDESNVPIIRMGYKTIQGMGVKTRPDSLSRERSPGNR